MGRRKETTDAELLRVARATFLEEGHGASTRAIAKAAGVSEAILFQRFGSKDRLFFLSMAAEGDGRPVFAAPKGQVTRIWFESTAVRLQQHFQDHLPVMLAVAGHPDFRRRSGQHRRLLAGDHALLAEVQTALLRGGLSAEPAEQAALALIALSHSLALYRWMGAPDSMTGKKTMRRLAGLLWAGLPVSRPAPRRRMRTAARPARR